MTFLLLYLAAAFTYGFIVTYRAYAHSRLPVDAIDLLLIPLIWIGSGLLWPVFVGVWLFEQWERWQWRRVNAQARERFDTWDDETVDFDLSDLEPDTQRSTYSEPPEVIEGGAEKLGGVG